MPISTIAIAISTLFGDGLAAFFSLNLGQGNSEKAARGVGTAVIASGVASGSQPIIGFNYGARKFDRVKKTFLLPAGLLDQMVEVCGDALAGRTDDQPFQLRDLKACITKACDPQFLRKDGKAAI